MNGYIRARTIGWWAWFENANVVETVQNSGLWKTVTDTPGITLAMTGDGTHPSPYGYGVIQKSGAINTVAFN
jgi:hypothetical protein